MQGPTPPPPAQAQDIGDQIRQQVRENVDAARQAARDAAQSARSGAGGNVATAPEATPTAITVVPFDPNLTPVMPPEAVDMSIAFFVVTGLTITLFPLVRAFARKMDRKGQAPGRAPAEITAQLTQLSQSVEAIAIEVERISEGQRFTTKLLSDIQARRGTLLGADLRADPPS